MFTTFKKIKELFNNIDLTHKSFYKDDNVVDKGKTPDVCSWEMTTLNQVAHLMFEENENLYFLLQHGDPNSSIVWMAIGSMKSLNIYSLSLFELGFELDSYTYEISVYYWDKSLELEKIEYTHRDTKHDFYKFLAQLYQDNIDNLEVEDKEDLYKIKDIILAGNLELAAHLYGSVEIEFEVPLFEHCEIEIK